MSQAPDKMSRQIFDGFLAKSVSELMSRIIYFFFFSFVARYLGTESFGLWSVAVAFVALVSVGMEFGLGGKFVTDALKLDSLARLVTIRLWMTGLSFLIGAAVCYLTYQDNQTRILIFAALVQGVAFSVVEMDVGILDGRRQLIDGAKIRIISRLLLVGISTSVLLLRPGVEGLAIGISLSSVFVLIFALWNFYRMTKGVELKVDRKNFAKNLREILPLALSTICVAGYFRTDPILLRFLGVDQNAVGNYYAAYRVIEIIMVLPAIFVATVLPFMVSNQKDNQNVITVFRKSLGVLWVGSVFVAVTICMGSGILVKILYGDGYAESIGILSLLSISVLVLFQNFILVNALLVEGKLVRLLQGALLGLAVGLSFRVFLIPYFGVYACAWGIITVEMVLWCFYSLSLGENRRGCISIKRSASLFTLMAALLLLAHHIQSGWGVGAVGLTHFFLGIALLILMLSLLYIFKFLTRQDLRDWTAFLKAGIIRGK